MTAEASHAVFTAFLVFCRVGACLMLLPGIGGRHLPVQVRLFLAVAISLAFTPLLRGEMEAAARLIHTRPAPPKAAPAA